MRHSLDLAYFPYLYLGIFIGVKTETPGKAVKNILWKLGSTGKAALHNGFKNYTSY